MLPDLYKALGIDKTADAATIKASHRKLVLKCHPDKVKDPELREEAAKQFYKIQQAYEILGDEEKRARYE
ncbi:heat shock protein DnaJ, partial [Phaeosphaeriaceae sp. SRC1lsM3a]